jgi:spore germination cell wall hydrolase CwlJ-like protein
VEEHARALAAYGGEMRRRGLATAAVLVLLVATVFIGQSVLQSWSDRHLRVFHPVAGLDYDQPLVDVSATTPDNPVAMAFQKISANDAYRYNESIPVVVGGLATAPPFVLPVMAGVSNDRALYCLTAAVYYEAASEGAAGQQAVAQVVLNRVRHPAFANSVCGVVFSGSQRATGCQFTFTCDGAMARKPSITGWARARSVAQAALNGFVYAGVGTATHYHTLWVAPYWSPSLTKVANIGAHTFYRWKGNNGLPPAFNSRYAGFEPAPTPGGRAEVVLATAVPVAIEVLEATPPAPAMPAAEAPLPEAPIIPIPQPTVVVEAAPVAATPPPQVLVENDRPRRRIAKPSW